MNKKCINTGCRRHNLCKKMLVALCGSLLATGSVCASAGEGDVSRQMRLGYTAGNMGLSLGYMTKLIVKGAIELEPSKLEPISGSSITSLRIAVGNKLTCQNNYVFITDDLYGEPLYRQDVAEFHYGWNEVALDVPFEIDGRRLFVGYRYESEGETLSLDGEKDNDLANWISISQTSEEGGSWEHQGGGALNIQAVVEGDNLPQNDIAMVVAGQEVEMFEALPGQKVALTLIAFHPRHGRKQRHVRREQDAVLFGVHKLGGEPILTQLDLQQRPQAHLGLVLPLHFRCAGAVGGKNIPVCQQNAGTTGTAYPVGHQAQIFQLTGAIVSGPLNGRFSGKGCGAEHLGLFPGVHGHTRMEHRHQHLGHPVQAEAVDNGIFGRTGHGAAGKEGQEPIRLFGGQQLFCLGREPQTAQAIAVIGADEVVVFETLNCKIRIGTGVR